VTGALKAQHEMKLLKTAGKREMEKSDIAKVYEKGKTRQK
jgi:hypothetical protein